MDRTVDPDKYPLLAALLAYDSTGALREELARLRSDRSRRHPRKRTQAVARLLAGDFERSIVLSDISRSGVSLVLPRQAGGLPFEALVAPRLLLRTAERVVEVQLSFVRMIASREEMLHAAFRFEDLSEADADALDRLGSLLVSDLFRTGPDLLSEDLA